MRGGGGVGVVELALLWGRRRGALCRPLVERGRRWAFWRRRGHCQAKKLETGEERLADVINYGSLSETARLRKQGSLQGRRPQHRARYVDLVSLDRAYTRRKISPMSPTASSSWASRRSVWRASTAITVRTFSGSYQPGTVPTSGCSTFVL